MNRQQALQYLARAIECVADGRIADVPTLALLDVATTFYALGETKNGDRAMQIANRSVYAEAWVR